MYFAFLIPQLVTMIVIYLVIGIFADSVEWHDSIDWCDLEDEEL